MPGLQSIFFSLSGRYTADKQLSDRLWKEIEKAYSGKKRHYHNLIHLEHLYRQLEPVQSEIQDWDMLLFVLFYHDIVYKVSQHDNEEKSAELARERLAELNIPEERMECCVAHILATKGHTIASDPDTNVFTDADLSILGQPQHVYAEYCRQVRQEYAMYPDFLYKPGRKKVLRHFLEMERIFKTAHFYEALEMQARANLRWEIEQD
jgi:predicted metal-dependent HD superfamily phosphohydrolase